MNNPIDQGYEQFMNNLIEASGLYLQVDQYIIFLDMLK